jgi:hypothetical protein
MHSHDRTLLAQLGFADPDKRNREHDLACQFISRPEVARRLVNWPLTTVDTDEGRLELEGERRWWDYKSTTYLGYKFLTKSELEVPIQKGVDRFATTVGFLDVLIHVVSCGTSTKFGVNKRSWRCREYHESQEGVIGVEIKIQPTSLGDILRQMRLYQEYFTVRQWYLVTKFALSEDAILQLNKHRISTARLGTEFDEFVARKPKAGTPDVSL